MKREDIIFEKLNSICEKKYKKANWETIEKVGFSANELSELLNLDRANISKDLNELVKKGMIIKFIGRPTLFFSADILRKVYNIEFKTYEFKSIDEIRNKNNEDSFNIIGLEGSLKTCFDQLNAAIMYPPFGLHTLLYGKTGVGKSMMADLMYSVAQRDLPDKFKSYITFNCADYSHTPNLLMAELFGSIKGAYTGADGDRVGIIENANNGILFLDEVHRLPPEGQEMLFYVMDKGLYRRLGESKEFRKANVLIICATTENPENVLLPTFYRRIPMKIYIPAYSERPVDERKRLVELYFNGECKVLNKIFKVDSEVIDLLSTYNCKGNVGQLKNDIKLMSARAFAKTITSLEDEIVISKEEAAKIIGENINVDKNSNGYVIFNGTGSLKQNTNSADESLYENLLNKLNELSLENCSKEEIQKSMNKEINKYFKLDERDSSDSETIKRFVDGEVIELSKILLDLAKNKLDKNYNNSNILTLSLHLKSTINRLKDGQVIKNNKINHIRKKYPKEFMIALEAAEKIEKKISLSIPLNEVGFFTLLLASLNNKSSYHSKVGVLVVCHGDNIASSMLNLANKMLDNNIGEAINVPLEKSSEITIVEIVDSIKKLDEGKGVLILIDMGLVSNVKDVIKEKSGVEIEIIEKVSTPIVIRSIEKSVVFEGTAKELKKEIMSDYYQDTSYSNEPKIDVNDKNKIIIYCLTGRGASVRLKEFICENIDKKLLDKVEIFIEDEELINLDEVKVKLKYDNKILASIGTFKNNFRDIPYISAEEILLQDGIKKLSNIIQQIEGYNPYKEGETSLSKVLKFVNPVMLVKEFKKIVLNFENHFSINFDPKIIVVVILHLGCMVEDLILGKSMKEYDDYTEFYEKHTNEIHRFRDLFKSIENIFNISIPESEIIRITEILIEN